MKRSSCNFDISQEKDAHHVRLIFLGQGVGEKDEEDVTTALTIDVPKVAF